MEHPALKHQTTLELLIHVVPPYIQWSVIIHLELFQKSVLPRSTRHPTQTMPSGIALPTMDLNRERLVSSLSQSLEGRKCYFLNCVSPSFPKMGHMEPRISSGKGSKTGGKHDPRTMRRRVCFLFSLLSSSNYCFLTQGRRPEEVVCH